MAAKPHPIRPGYVSVEVPNPPAGKRYMMMELDEQLVLDAGALIANGTAETELQARLENCIREFLASQPIDIALPSVRR
jgi:hypothetical protein